MAENQNISTNKFFRYIQKHFKRMGAKVLYSALLLFNAYRRNETPGWAKNIVIGAIAYFVSPIDGIPDLSPFLGFTDDLGVMSFALVSIACYINDDVREKARNQLGRIVKDYDETLLEEVDRIL